jgi:hypothetical protein
VGGVTPAAHFTLASAKLLAISTETGCRPTHLAVFAQKRAKRALLCKQRQKWKSRFSGTQPIFFGLLLRD